MARAALLDTNGQEIARAALIQKRIDYGPWKGSMRSVAADLVPPEYAASITPATNFLYVPRSGRWRRRLGQTQKFDTFGSATGMLPAKWGGRARQLEEFTSASISDGIPTVCGLVTKETIATANCLDDGRFSNFWLRDQVNSLNYTVGSEYNSTTYPDPGTTQTYRVVTLWYDSGDGGITRGTSEFNRRFFFSGSRRFLKVGNWTYHPSVLGTPSRWNNQGMVSSAVAVTLTASSTLSAVWAPDATHYYTSLGGATTLGSHHTALQSDDGASSFIAINVGSSPLGTNPEKIGLSGTVVPGQTYTVSLKVFTLSGTLPGGSFFAPSLVDSAGNQWRVLSNVSIVGIGTTATLVTASITCSGTPTSTGNTANAVWLDAQGGESFVACSYVTVTGSATTSDADRLIPSGPIPPTHAGLLVKGNMVAGSAGTTTIRPDADVSDGAWLGQDAGTSLFSYIDETTVNDADYIVDAGSPGTLCEIGLGDPGFTPAGSTHTMRISLRASGDTIAAVPTLTVHLRDATTTLATASFTAAQLTSGGATAARWVSYDLTSSEVTAAGLVATDLRLRFTAGGTGGVRVYYAAIEITATGEALLGGWRGKDRFFHSVAYRFADDSVWMPCTPRFPNTRLANGYNLFTVDSANTDTAFDKITWSNLPVPPQDVKKLLLLRTPKIDSTTDDNLQLNPYDLRVVAEVDSGVTSYDDYFSEDDALGVDAEQLIIRYDHIMPPRSRYIVGGDMRVCHSYGGTNPCAIEIAAVGAAADYDRNLADTNSSAYAVKGMYFRIVIDSAGVGSLQLKRGSDTAVTHLFTDHPKLQDLVDKINAGTFADTCGQWRAQLCPGVNPDAACLTSLTPHSRAIASVVTTISNANITKAAGGLSKVPVGARVSGTGIANDTYVDRIDSDTSLHLSANATASGTVTLTFYFDLGDTPDTGFERQGWQRVIANSLPGFMYFNKTYLDTQTFDKSATWMTTAAPGSNKSAPNCFSGRLSNRFTPPLTAGPSQGGGACDQGFVIPYANKVGVIRNTTQSEQGSGIDSEYRLIMINESSGCCAWNTVTAGNRFVVYMKPEGLYAADLSREIPLSEAIWLHAPNGTGDFSFEMPLAIAATARDIDYDLTDSTITSYASARIMRSALWVNYRVSGSHPNRQVCYDFSTGELAGLEALQRSRGEPWGWSVPLVRSITAMTEGRRSDGAHLYGWNDANAGSTGDGRIDEIETSETDNGTAITADIDLPLFRVGENLLSAQEFTVEHSSPAGSTGSYTFHRMTTTNDPYTLTPGTGSATYIRDVKMLTLPARAPAMTCWLTYSQATGNARELRKIELRVKSLPSYR